jgi:hypothetical protein
MLRRIVPVTVVLLLLGLAAARAQDPPDPAKATLIREVLVLTQVAEQSLAVMENAVAAQRQVSTDIPEVFWDRFLAKAKTRIGELVERLVPVYAAAFSTDDLQGLITFYRSPVGKRLLEAQPTLVQASMKAGEAWGAELGMEVGRELAEEGIE